MSAGFQKFDQPSQPTGGPPNSKRGGFLGKCFGCCIGRHDASADTQPLNILQPRTQNSFDELLEKSSRAREDMWQELGTLEPLVLSHLAFRVVKRSNGNVIMASDGLSDPFDDMSLGEGNVNGFGLEFYIETPGSELADSGQDIKSSWQFQLLYTVSQLAAGKSVQRHGSIRSILDDMKLLSTEAEGVNDAIPDAFKTDHVNAAGRVGALLGLKPQGTDMPQQIEEMPLTDVNLVNIKLLTLRELQLITEKGPGGRQQLNEVFDGPERLLSSLKRQSAI
eukprot:jgi/Astpho2/4539/Aster-x1258